MRRIESGGEGSITRGASVNRAAVNVRRPELLQFAEALKLRRVKELHHRPRERNVPMDRIVEDLTCLGRVELNGFRLRKVIHST